MLNDKIKAYANLEFKVNHPKIRFSVEKVTGEIIEGETLEGEFMIYSSNDVDITGNVEVYDHLIELKEGDFNKTSFTVRYVVHAENVKAGDSITGSFHCLTNGGEFDLLYEYEVTPRFIRSSNGDITDLKEFTDLASMHFDEAVRIFSDVSFKKLLLTGDVHTKDRKIYDALRAGENLSHGLEEFLVTLGLKDRVCMSLMKSNVNVIYNTEDIAKNISLKKSGWGYSELNVECDSKAVFLSKTKIYGSDFVGKEYKLPIVIVVDEISRDVIDIPIHFYNTYESFTYVLKLKKKGARAASSVSMFSNYSLKKVYKVQIKRDYIDYRSGKLSLKSYVDRTIECTNELMKLEEGNHVYRLLRLHMYILSGNEAKVKQEIETIDGLGPLMINDALTNCYYHYLKALYYRDDEHINEALELAIDEYENNPKGYEYFLIISYLDQEMMEDKAIVLEGLELLYNQGVDSPLVYYEAVELINEFPQMVKELDDFTLTTLLWGIRRDYLNGDTKSRILKLLETNRGYNAKLYKLLSDMYDKNPTDELLKSILVMLIKGNVYGERYFRFYKLGVDKNYKLIGLLEGYLRSIDKSDYSVLPKSLVLYFEKDDSRINDDIRAYLYANIALNAKSYESTYFEYESKIKEFVIENIKAGNINEQLVILYRSFLKDSHVIASVGGSLSGILFMDRFTCDNPNIISVLVDYDEQKNSVTTAVNDGLAYVEHILDNANITLIDKNHKRYSGSIDYTMEPLFDSDEFLPYCYEADPSSFTLMLKLADYAKNSPDIDYEMVKVYKNLLLFDEISDEYRKLLNGKILKYYYAQYEGDVFEEYLKTVDMAKLDIENRARALEYMIDRELYEQAFEGVKAYGYEVLSEKSIKELLSCYVEMDEVFYDDTLYAMALDLFHLDDYTEAILRYLIKYAKGGNKELLGIYNTAKTNHLDTLDLEERIITQAVMSEDYDDDMTEVYLSYQRGKYNIYIYKAYVNMLAYRYMVKNVKVSEAGARALAESYEAGVIREPLTVSAFVYALSEYVELAKNDYMDALSDAIKLLTAKDMLFPFFLKFDGIVPLPKECYYKTFIIYSGAEVLEPMLHCHQKGTRLTDAKTERMREYFEGYYVKDMVLFNDEEIEVYMTYLDGGEMRRIEQEQLEFLRPVNKGGSRFKMINDMTKFDVESEELTDRMRLYIKGLNLLEQNMTLM